MAERNKRLEEYKKTGYYYISTESYDLLWIDKVGEWTMNVSASKMRSCMELDRVALELDEDGCEIISIEFGIDPDDFKLEQMRHMNPLELKNSKSVKR